MSSYGTSGTGKSTLGSQYVLAALERGEHVVSYLFEETRETFLARSNGIGMNFTPHIDAGDFADAGNPIAKPAHEVSLVRPLT